MLNAYAQIFQRELEKLRKEILAYEDETGLWLLAGEISNSAGTLTLHLVGNLQHFIGAVLGDSGYVRDRDAEFTAKNVPRQNLLDAIDKASKIVSQTFTKLDPGILSEKYQSPVRPEPVTVHFWLLHLISHFSYHLGQINYHRRLSQN